MPDSSAILEIVLKARDEASKTIEDVGKKAGGTAEILSKSFKDAAIVSGVALGGLTIAAVESVKEFDKYQTTVNQMNAVLKSTGDASGETKKQLLTLSEAMQAQTTYSHSTVLSAEDLLLTFTNIHKNVFPQTTQAVLDIATAMHEDLQSAAIQVGKAMNDPATGMAQLHRIGVAFTKQQMDTAKQMEATGNIAGAQAIVLGELGKEFGGSATAGTKSFGGQLAQLNNVFGDIKETVGGFIEKAIAPLLPKLNSIAESFLGWINGSRNMDSFIKSLTTNLGGFGTIIGNVITFFEKNRIALLALAGAFGGILSISILAATVAMLGFIGVSLPVLGIFTAVGAAVALLAVGWKTNFGGMRTALEREFSAVVAAFNTVRLAFTVLWDVFVLGWTAIQFAASAFGTWFGSTFGPSLKKPLNDLSLFWNTIWSGMSTLVKNIMPEIANAVKTGLNDAIGFIDNLIKGANSVGSKIPGFAKIPEIPKFENGGYVPSTGLAIVHQGEFVLSKAMLQGRQSVPSQVTNTTNNSAPVTIYATINSDIDMNLFGHQIAFAVRNSR